MLSWTPFQPGHISSRKEKSWLYVQQLTPSGYITTALQSLLFVTKFVVSCLVHGWQNFQMSKMSLPCSLDRARSIDKVALMMVAASSPRAAPGPSFQQVIHCKDFGTVTCDFLVQIGASAFYFMVSS